MPSDYVGNLVTWFKDLHTDGVICFWVFCKRVQTLVIVHTNLLPTLEPKVYQSLEWEFFFDLKDALLGVQERPATLLGWEVPQGWCELQQRACGQLWQACTHLELGSVAHTIQVPPSQECQQPPPLICVDLQAVLLHRTFTSSQLETMVTNYFNTWLKQLCCANLMGTLLSIRGQKNWENQYEFQ